MITLMASGTKIYAEKIFAKKPVLWYCIRREKEIETIILINAVPAL